MATTGARTSPAAERLASARLYPITPDEDPERILELASAFFRAGVGMIQLRHKTLPRGDLLELAGRLAPLARKEGRLLIVNDHLDVALAAGADGVHLGQEDLSIASARRLAGTGFLIGASAGDPEEARRAVSEGADYIGAGPAFPTPVKASKPPIGPSGVAAVAAAVPVPVFAIGGIDAAGIPALLAAGVHRACVIRALAGSPDPESAARHLSRLLA